MEQHNRTMALLAAFGTTSLLLGAVTYTHVRSSDSAPAAQVMEMHGYELHLDPAALAARAQYGVVGEVISVSKPSWSTPGGGVPHAWVRGESGQQPEVIYRSVVVKVHQSVLGSFEQETVRVAVVGGTLDNVQMTGGTVSRELKPGDEVIVFTVAQPDGWRLGSDNVGILQMYRLEGDTAVWSAGEHVRVTADELIRGVRAAEAR